MLIGSPNEQNLYFTSNFEVVNNTLYLDALLPASTRSSLAQSIRF